MNDLQHQEKQFWKQMEREKSGFWKRLGKEAAQTAKERARYRMTGQNRSGCPIEVLLGVGAVLCVLSLVFAIVDVIERTIQGLIQFAGTVLAWGAGIYAGAFVVVFLLGPLADLLRRTLQSWKYRRHSAATVARSPFPRHEYLHDERYLDAVIWKLIDSYLGRQTVQIRNSWSLVDRKNRRIAECMELREMLLHDRDYYAEWRSHHMHAILRDRYSQPPLTGVYNEILKRLRAEAWGQKQPTEFLEVVGFTIVRDPDPAARWLFTTAALYFLTWGQVGGSDQASMALTVSGPEDYARQKVRAYLAHGDQFRRFMERYFFEIMGEIGPFEFYLPKVHEYYRKEQEQEGHYALLPGTPLASTKFLPAKSRTAEEAEELKRHRKRAAELTRQAKARKRERERQVKKLRKKYLRSTRPGVLYSLFSENRSDLETEIRDLLITQHDGNEDEAELELERLRSTKSDFLEFWKAHEAEILEAYDERVTAQSMLTPEEEHTAWVEETVTRALRCHRREQDEMCTNGYTAIDFEYGYLLAEAREQVRQNLPEGTSEDIDNYLERALRDLLGQSDGRARERRYVGEDVRRALRDCEDFRQGGLVYGEMVEELGYAPAGDRDTLAIVFAENAVRWRKRKSARSSFKELFRKKETPVVEPPAPVLQPARQPGRARDADELLTESEAAEVLRLSGRALQDWRVRGHGPPFVKVSGRAIRYRFGDLQVWIKGQLRTSTSDPGSPEDE